MNRDMTAIHEGMKSAIKDIKDICRLLDPEGMKRADEQKRLREEREMRNALTATHDLQRETIRKVTDIVFSENKGDALKVVEIIATICEHEMLYDQMMEGARV